MRNQRKLTDRGHKAPAAVKTSSPKPAPKLEPAAERVTKARKIKLVGNGSVPKLPVGNAARQAKWRAQHPEQHRDQMRALRAKRKAGKAVGS